MLNVEVIICSDCNGQGVKDVCNPNLNLTIPGDPRDVVACTSCNGDGFFLKEKSK